MALTQAATVLLDEKVVLTDQPVRIEMGPNTLTGIGMRLDSQTRQLQVDSRVRGHLAPREGASTGRVPEATSGSDR